MTQENKLNINECEEMIKIIMNSKEYTPIKGVILEKLHNQIHQKLKVMEVRGYKDYIFHDIECMISYDEIDLGFFKSCNDVRPSSATYIKKEDAEHLYNIFNNK